jgi:phosphatidylglycerophosphatase GEP4
MAKLYNRDFQSFNFNGIKLFLKYILKPKLFIPNQIVPSIAEIDFITLKNSGFKAIVFDKDNTLTAPYSSKLFSPFAETMRTASMLFKCLIVSNSLVNKHSCLQVEKSIGLPVFRQIGKKPFGGEELSKYLGCESKEIIIVGDRVITDILYGI